MALHPGRIVGDHFACNTNRTKPILSREGAELLDVFIPNINEDLITANVWCTGDHLGIFMLVTKICLLIK